MNSTIAAQSISIATATAWPAIFCISKSLTSATPQLAARDYLQKYGHLLGIEHAQLDHLGLSPEAAPIAAPVEYRFQDEKVQFDTTALVFAQTCLDLPIREATGARGGGVPVTRSPCVGVTASRTTPKGATAAGSP
jgi:hypothetical protein